MTQKKSIADIHAEIAHWKSNVQLVKADIAIFQDQLIGIVKKNNHKDALKGVEHFQNQFIRELEVSDELLHDLHEMDHVLALEAGSGIDSSHILVKEKVQMKDKVETFNKIFGELKNEYHLFLRKWM